MQISAFWLAIIFKLTYNAPMGSFKYHVGCPFKKMVKNKIYLGNAATSWLKPEKVYLAADEALHRGGNPGRSGHKLSTAAGRTVEENRMLLARLFSVSKPENIVFTA